MQPVHREVCWSEASVANNSQPALCLHAATTPDCLRWQTVSSRHGESPGCRSLRNTSSPRKPVVTRRLSGMSGGRSSPMCGADGRSAEDTTSRLRQRPVDGPKPRHGQPSAMLPSAVKEEPDDEQQGLTGAPAHASAVVAHSSGSDPTAAAADGSQGAAAAAKPARSGPAVLGSGHKQLAQPVSSGAGTGQHGKRTGQPFRLAVGKKRQEGLTPSSGQPGPSVKPASMQPPSSSCADPAAVAQPRPKLSQQPRPVHHDTDSAATTQPAEDVFKGSREPETAWQVRSAYRPASTAAKPGVLRDPNEAAVQQGEQPKPRWQQRRERPHQQQQAPAAAFPAAGSKRAGSGCLPEAGSAKRQRLPPAAHAPHDPWAIPGLAPVAEAAAPSGAFGTTPTGPAQLRRQAGSPAGWHADAQNVCLPPSSREHPESSPHAALATTEVQRRLPQVRTSLPPPQRSLLGVSQAPTAEQTALQQQVAPMACMQLRPPPPPPPPQHQQAHVPPLQALRHAQSLPQWQPTDPRFQNWQQRKMQQWQHRNLGPNPDTGSPMSAAQQPGAQHVPVHWAEGGDGPPGLAPPRTVPGNAAVAAPANSSHRHQQHDADLLDPVTDMGSHSPVPLPPHNGPAQPAVQSPAPQPTTRVELPRVRFWCCALPVWSYMSCSWCQIRLAVWQEPGCRSVASALQVFFAVPDRDVEAAAQQAKAPPGLAENDVRVHQCLQNCALACSKLLNKRRLSAHAHVTDVADPTSYKRALNG